MVIFEESIIITTCIVFLLRLLVSHHQAQQALLWLYSRQWIRMRQEEEAIQNGLLQESFIMRRYLELSLASRSKPQQKLDQYYLATIEKFDHSLKKLSDFLSPAYIDDSLPLAIHYLLESWKSHVPEINLEMDVPDDWHHESHQTNRIILMALEELLQITLPEVPSSLSILVSLKSRRCMNELMVELAYPNVAKLSYGSNLADLDYLRHAFQFLTSGKCFFICKQNTQTWYFRWRCCQTTPH